jgi:urease accessory protein UreH
MNLDNQEVTFPGKHILYDKKLWSNKDEHITMNATVENEHIVLSSYYIHRKILKKH